MAWYYLLTLLLGGILGWWLKHWQWQRRLPDFNRAALRERVFAGQPRSHSGTSSPPDAPDSLGITGKPDQIAQALAESVDTVERLELQVRDRCRILSPKSVGNDCRPRKLQMCPLCRQTRCRQIRRRQIRRRQIRRRQI